MHTTWKNLFPMYVKQQGYFTHLGKRINDYKRMTVYFYTTKS